MRTFRRGQIFYLSQRRIHMDDTWLRRLRLLAHHGRVKEIGWDMEYRRMIVYRPMRAWVTGRGKRELVKCKVIKKDSAEIPPKAEKRGSRRPTQAS